MVQGEKQARQPVVIASFGNRELADLAAAMLAAEGVPVFLEHGMTRGIFRHLTKVRAGVRLLVPAVLVALATALLRAEYAESVMHQEEPVATGDTVCPECGSLSIEPRSRQQRSGPWQLLLGLPARL